MSEKRSLKVAIIGAGMSGLCMAAKLQDAGIETFTIFEKADEVGGTWRDNTYPGSVLRRPVTLLHVFVPTQPRLVTPHVAGPGDSLLLPTGRNRTRHPSAHSVRNRRHVRPVPGRAVVGGHRRRRGSVRRADHRDGFSSGPAIPGHPRARQLRRPDVSLVAVGPLGYVAGQTHRIDRDRLHRGANHRRTRWKGQWTQSLSAHPAMGVSHAEPALLAVHQDGAAALGHPQQARLPVLADLHRAWVRSRDGRAMLAAPRYGGDVPLESAALGARSRTAPQADARLPGHVQAADSCWATITRPSRSQASISSARRSTTSNREASSPRTERCTNSICSCWPPGSMPVPTSVRWRSSASTASNSTRPGRRAPRIPFDRRAGLSELVHVDGPTLADRQPVAGDRRRGPS